MIRAPLTVETLAWHRGDSGPSHDHEPESITQLALVRAMADVVQERVDEAAADLVVAGTHVTASPRTAPASPRTSQVPTQKQGRRRSQYWPR